MLLEQLRSSYDTWNLRNDACFSTKISNGLYWIPCNTFGKTNYTNEEIQKLSQMPNEVQNKKLNNIYEVIQFFQNINFEVSNSKPFFLTDDGLKWQYQAEQKQVCNNCKGSCCEMAMWLNYYASKFFDKSGYIIIQRPINGHVLNYFFNGKKYYFIDIEAHHIKYKNGSLAETGNIRDYYTSKYFSGALIETNSIEDFVNYYAKIANFANAEFVFYRLPSGNIPPISMELTENSKNVFLSRKYDIEILNEAKNIKTKFVDYFPTI